MFCESCAFDSPSTIFCVGCDAFLPAACMGMRAGITRRLLATLIDCVLAVTFCILFLLNFSETLLFGAGTALVAVAVTVFLASFVRGLAIGQTPGKLALKLRVVDRATGRIPGLGRMLLRETVGKVLSGASLGFGFLAAFRNADGQAWHDRMASTAVVLDEPSVVAPETPLRSRALWPFGAVSAVLLLLFVALAPFPQVHDSGAPARVATNAEGFITPLAAPALFRAKPSAGRLLRAGSTPAYASAPASTRGGSQPFAVHTAPSSVSPLVATAAVHAVAPASSVIAAPVRFPANAPGRNRLESVNPAASIGRTLDGWAYAMAHNSPAEISSFYGDRLDRYFLARNVSNSFVHQDKAAFLRSGRSLFRFRLDQVHIVDAQPGRVEVSAVKQWIILDRAKTGGRIGATHSRIWLSNINGTWKITGEQDLL